MSTETDDIDALAKRLVRIYNDDGRCDSDEDVTWYAYSEDTRNRWRQVARYKHSIAARPHQPPLNVNRKWLSVIVGGLGVTHWLYAAREGCRILDTVLRPNYFQEANDLLSAGDVIHVSAFDGNAMCAVMSDKSVVVMVRTL